MGYRFSFPRTIQSLVVLSLVFLIGFLNNLNLAQNNQQNQNIKYDKMFLSAWRIEDPKLINWMLNEFMLPKEGVAAIELIDINENGPDRFDVLRITPESRKRSNSSDKKDIGIYQVYALSEIGVPESVKEEMKNWELGSGATQTTVLPSLEDAKKIHERKKTSKSSIILTLLTAIFQNYKDNDFKLMLERQPNGQYVFEIVGFDEESSTYTPPWDPDKDLNETLIQEMTGAEIMRAFFDNLKDIYRNELLIMYRERVDTVYINDSEKIRRAKGK